MSDAAKKYTLTLGKHSEEVSQAEHDSIKKVLGDVAFSQYEVKDLQPAKPTDATPAPKPKATEKPS